MEMRGKKFHLAEFDVDEEFAKPIRDAFSHQERIQVKVFNLVKEEDTCCVIAGSCFDKELCVIAPTFSLLKRNLTMKEFVRSIKPFETGLVVVTEYLLIERVCDWIGNPIPDYYRIVEISS